VQGLDGTIDTNIETDAMIRRESLTFIVDMWLEKADIKNPLAQVLDADPKGLPPMYINAGGMLFLMHNIFCLP
jgi:hypothetical protein